MNPPLTSRRERPPPEGRDSDLEYFRPPPSVRPPLSDGARVALRAVALPTYLAARTMLEAADVAGARSLAALAALAEAEAWLSERKGRRGAPRARRVLRARTLRALEAVDLLDRAIDAAREWAVRFAREMEAVSDAERAYRAAQFTSAVQW